MDATLSRVHCVYLACDKNEPWVAQGPDQLSLWRVVKYFVQHGPAPPPFGVKVTRNAQVTWMNARSRAIDAEARRVHALAGVEYMPVAELRSFLLEAVLDPVDRARIGAFDFDALGKAVARQWNAHIESHKRSFDALLVSDADVAKQRPWKRARLDVLY
jgi:hypothetical protein